jgi:hypothetical protein
MNIWTIAGIIGLGIPIVYEKARRLLYYCIPDWCLYSIQCKWYAFRIWNIDKGGAQIPSPGGHQFYQIITFHKGSYCANWLCLKFQIFILWTYSYKILRWIRIKDLLPQVIFKWKKCLEKKWRN